MTCPAKPRLYRGALPIALMLLVGSSGCIGLTTNLLYAIKGRKLPAEFAGLEGKRVAVVCLAASPSQSPDSSTDLLAHGIENLLAERVKQIEIVPREEVEDWVDRNGWDEIDYRDVGRGVNADMVVAIDLHDFTLHEGQGLYRGRANLAVTVYDMTRDGRTVFRRTTSEYEFPQSGPRFATETSESTFRRAFLQVLAQQTARYFYPYDIDEEFARDVAYERF